MYSGPHSSIFGKIWELGKSQVRMKDKWNGRKLYSREQPNGYWGQLCDSTRALLLQGLADLSPILVQISSRIVVVSTLPQITEHGLQADQEQARRSQNKDMNKIQKLKCIKIKLLTASRAYHQWCVLGWRCTSSRTTWTICVSTDTIASGFIKNWCKATRAVIVVYQRAVRPADKAGLCFNLLHWTKHVCWNVCHLVDGTMFQLWSGMAGPKEQNK